MFRLLFWLMFGWILIPIKVIELCIKCAKCIDKAILTIFVYLLVFSLFIAFGAVCLPFVLIVTVLGICFKKAYPNIKYKNAAFDSMDGAEFERYCAYLLEKNGFHNVRVTKTSGDHGIDVLAKRNNYTYAIQCKRFSSKVGNRAVQEAFTGRALYNANIAVVLTNNFFTDQAIEDARALGVQLWDRYDLIRMIH